MCSEPRTAVLARCGERARLDGAVFNIERHALHDGPGIRTLVFLKGCPLRCRWCSNPEGQSAAPEIIYYSKRCTACRLCLPACPAKAIRASEGRVLTDRSACTGCGACVPVCESGARKLAGRKVSVAEVLAAIRQDEIFYRHSGGGVTLSGGEPLQQMDFLEPFLEGCREFGIHTALETCGYAPAESFDRILRSTDLFMFDLKHLDDAKHRAWTGVSNQTILKNLERLAAEGAKMIVRVPVVPGFNYSFRELAQMVSYLEGFDAIEQMHLLPYHRLGTPKYESLERKYSLPQDSPVSVAMLHELADRLPRRRLELIIDV